MRLTSRSGAVSAEPSRPALDATVSVQPFRFDTSVTVDVRLVRWPEQAQLREELALVGIPRVVVLDGVDCPPPAGDELEDWIRVPLDRADLVVRATTVARRADQRERPWHDGQGVVGFRERWCQMPESQAATVRLLVERFGAVVRDDEIFGVYAEGRASAHSEAVKTSMRRIKQGLAPLGLRLTRVRGSGYLLDRAE
jgi:hypothetical protein